MRWTGKIKFFTQSTKRKMKKYWHAFNKGLTAQYSQKQNEAEKKKKGKMQ